MSCLSRLPSRRAQTVVIRGVAADPVLVSETNKHKFAGGKLLFCVYGQ